MLVGRNLIYSYTAAALALLPIIFIARQTLASPYNLDECLNLGSKVVWKPGGFLNDFFHGNRRFFDLLVGEEIIGDGEIGTDPLYGQADFLIGASRYPVGSNLSHAFQKDGLEVQFWIERGSPSRVTYFVVKSIGNIVIFGYVTDTSDSYGVSTGRPAIRAHLKGEIGDVFDLLIKYERKFDRVCAILDVLKISAQN